MMEQPSSYYYLHVFRLFITLVLLPLFRYKPYLTALTLALLLIALDLLDCNRVIVFLTKNNYCKTFQYQKLDKLTDLIAYVYALSLFYYLFDTRTIVLLILFILWRAIGVFQFQIHNHNGFIHLYPDFVNSTILIYYLSTKNRVVYDYYYLFVLLGMWFKAGWEKVQHNKAYVS